MEAEIRRYIENLRNKSPNRPCDKPIKEKRSYDLEVVGFKEKYIPELETKVRFNFGRIDGLRVYIYESDVDYQPGDKVRVNIRLLRPHNAFGRVIGNYGNFIDDIIKKQKIIDLRITERSKVNIRDVLSNPEIDGCGAFGVLAVVKETKFHPPTEGLDGKVYDICKVRLKRRSVDSTGKYVIVAQPINSDAGEGLDKEVYIGSWKFGNDTPNNDETSSLSLRERIPLIYRGIPISPDVALYFKSPDERTIATISDEMDVSSISPIDAVRRYADMCQKMQHKVALAGERVYGLLERSLIEAGNVPVKMWKRK